MDDKTKTERQIREMQEFLEQIKDEYKTLTTPVYIKDTGDIKPVFKPSKDRFTGGAKMDTLPKLDPQVKIETRSQPNGSTVVVVEIPGGRDTGVNFGQWAIAVGGRWRSPYLMDAWQFIAHNNDIVPVFIETLTKELAKWYPYKEQPSSSVNLNRNTNGLARQAPNTVVPIATDEKKISAAKIAQVVYELTAKELDNRVQSFKDDVRNDLTNTKVAISQEIVRAEDRIHVTEEKLNARLDQVLRPLHVTINTPLGPVTKDMGIQHKDFGFLLQLVMGLPSENRNVWIAGPAGSGKTHAAHQLADKLGLDFHFNGAIDTSYKLSGFIDAQGRMVTTAFYKAWKYGGVYLFDEIDRSMTSALLAFNAPLANGHADFPDGVVERHPNTIILAAGNTYGFGGDANYIGAIKQDAAFLNRFTWCPWDYDETLERALADHDEWVDVVQKTRQLMRQHKATMVISPRSSIMGASLLRSGMRRDQVVIAIFGAYRIHEKWSLVGRYAEEFARG